MQKFLMKLPQLFSRKYWHRLIDLRRIRKTEKRWNERLRGIRPMHPKRQ